MAKENDIDAIRDFMQDVKSKHAGGNATEPSYRTPLELLCNALGKKLDTGKVHAINEPKRIECGAPDLALMRKDITVGYLEAKDIGIDIRKFKDANKNQFDRYTKNLDNLIYTNCLDWDFYRDGNLMHSISIAELKAKKIIAKPDNFAVLASYLQNLMNQPAQPIKNAEELISRMAKRTEMICISFQDDMEGDNPSESLIAQRDWIDEVLVKDITTEKFTDMYAQTITYGLFVAKLYSEIHNKTPKEFIRQNISDLLPETHPFLKNLFKFIANDTLNPAIDGFINDLINLYRPATIKDIMDNYGKGTGREDPFIHFYEAFLTAYNPEERMLSGVYYTPKPVVDFIVRGVDWVLKNKFDLPEGLAHSKKVKVDWKLDSKEKEEFKTKPKDVHKVQILDPATGTGTFLAQTIRHIAQSKKKTGSAGWSSYVNNDLLPRLHGFEFMMAPYVMCYLKLDMVLAELDYNPPKKSPKRMSVYLTNSLTGANKSIPHLPFAKYLENEAKGATDIKDNFPIMCVIGNPPYNDKSINKDPWILDLMEDYKKEPGGHAHLKERNSRSINDDYVKFIRLAQHMVEKNGDDPKNKNGAGVIGMITNHGYLDNATFRGMRWNLMNSFDEIYILDLHGDDIKKTGENVFDIKTGVSIIIAWKTKRAEGTEKSLAKVFRGDIHGTYKEKDKFLSTKSLNSNKFKKLDPRAPDYFFKPVNYKLKPEYNKGFKINEFMKNNSRAITTHRDALVVDIDKKTLINRIKAFYDKTKTDQEIKDKFSLKEKNSWSINGARLKGKFDESHIKPCAFRPFDTRSIYYDSNLITRNRFKIMRYFLEKENLGLLVKRQCKQDFSYAFITDKITESCLFESSNALTTVLPLYTYPEMKDKDKQGKMKLGTARIVNMDKKIRKVIEDIATDSKHGTPDEKEIFDYIYGVLHAPEYRTRYAEFLKEDFPRIPYPKDSAEFWHLSSVGTKLRDLHLMKGDFDLAAYPFDGEDTIPIVEYVKFDGKRVWINDIQYFDNVPQSAWDFYIGGRQTAREWLTEREGQEIDYEDYQRIIAVLVQTKTTMDDIKWSRP